MATVTVPTYTGDIPSRTQDQSTFDTNVQDFLDYFAGAETTDVIPKINAAGTQISSDSSSAATSAANALLYQTGAQTAAAQAASSANASLWLVGTTYAEGDTVIDDIDYQAYRSTTAGNLGTQPSTDTSGDWLVVPQHTNVTTKFTLTVGASGDFTTINDAVKFIYDNYRVGYKNNGIEITINLLTGFTMAEQLLVSNIDLSWIRITAADATTTITRSSLTTSFGTSGLTSYPAFGALDGAYLPTISATFNMDTSGTGTDRHGIYVEGLGSSVRVDSGDGLTGAGGYGVLAVYGGNALVAGADFSSAGTFGIGVLKGGLAFADSATGTLSTTANTVTSAGIIFQ